MRIRRSIRNSVCALRPETESYCRQSGLISQGSRTDLLERLGLACSEIQDLDLRPPLLQEALEYARIHPGAVLDTAETVKLLEATHKVLLDHLQDIDRQLWMLQRRRDSMERKALVIEHILRVLRPFPKPRAA